MSTDNDDDLYLFTDAEIGIIRGCLRLQMEELNRKMKYERGEYSTTRRKEYDDIRELYIKLGGKS